MRCILILLVLRLICEEISWMLAKRVRPEKSESVYVMFRGANVRTTEVLPWWGRTG